ncbi:hypothetical protein HMPREF0043_00970 [Actinobaculum sp. oral taxon 183 str. F0552]|nr:hypothetical protein HMPREF0043_00970 [Actinobaculum sp. oral taxon 183 str. F0552]
MFFASISYPHHRLRDAAPRFHLQDNVTSDFGGCSRSFDL